MAEVIGWVKRLARGVQESDDAGLAAEMAYHLMLSLMPALVLLVSVFDLVGSRYNLFDESLVMLSRVAPREVMPLIRDTLGQIMEANSGRVALFGALGLLWTASNGAAVVLKGGQPGLRGDAENRDGARAGVCRCDDPGAGPGDVGGA